MSSEAKQDRTKTITLGLVVLVGIACAALLVIGLVFGGKWLYRKLANRLDKDKTTTTQTENQPSKRSPRQTCSLR